MITHLKQNNMTQDELTKYDFQKELIAMAVNCSGLQPSTAKKKASAIFKKYEGMIAYSESDKDYYLEDHRKYRKMFDTLKTGVISYSRGENSGRLLLKDIEQIEVREKDVLLITKTGREIILGDTFKYLKELF